MYAQSIQNEAILGVDTYLDMHVAAVISHTGRLLGTLATPTNTNCHQRIFGFSGMSTFARQYSACWR